MEFRLTEDQEALRAGIRDFCERRFGTDALRELEGERSVEAGLWRELAEMGVFSLREPEARGGLGLGMADAVVVFAELGRRLVPGPLVWTELAAPLVDGAGAGLAVVGGLDATGGGEGPWLVEHLDRLDALLVLRREGVERVDPARLAAKPAGLPLDPHTPLHLLEALPRGERLGEAELSRRIWLEGAALVAAQMLGIAEAALELANEYAKRREQFGRPIGSFQAIKHVLADMFVRQEVARAAVYAAGATLDDPLAGDGARAVASAKIVAGDAALRNARACIQIHGGMGYTWEVPAHYYLKRAYVCESLFGDADLHADRLALGVGERSRDA
jgi:alkylation response protein AidB-like acyl-CoA dehydrogenase